MDSLLWQRSLISKSKLVKLQKLGEILNLNVLKEGARPLKVNVWQTEGKNPLKKDYDGADLKITCLNNDTTLPVLFISLLHFRPFHLPRLAAATLSCPQVFKHSCLSLFHSVSLPLVVGLSSHITVSWSWRGCCNLQLPWQRPGWVGHAAKQWGGMWPSCPSMTHIVQVKVQSGGII